MLLIFKDYSYRSIMGATEKRRESGAGVAMAEGIGGIWNRQGWEMGVYQG
ncbi:hypothetical protein [Pseudomonas sp. TH10]|nr:hypothetical protein [Pseudomonas sp. TH10]MBK5519754.1 hypothetical protein [Pseudomonas sp. TH10]